MFVLGALVVQWAFCLLVCCWPTLLAKKGDTVELLRSQLTMQTSMMSQNDHINQNFFNRKHTNFHLNEIKTNQVLCFRTADNICLLLNADLFIFKEYFNIKWMWCLFSSANPDSDSDVWVKSTGAILLKMLSFTTHIFPDSLATFRSEVCFVTTPLNCVIDI